MKECKKGTKKIERCYIKKPKINWSKLVKEGLINKKQAQYLKYAEKSGATIHFNENGSISLTT